MRRYAGKAAALVFGLLIFLFGIWYQDIEVITEMKEWFRILSNAALLPGVLLTGFGLLVRIADEGIFDGIKYAFSSTVSHLKGTAKQYASYYDYIHRTKKKNNASTLLVTGLLFLAVAIILTVLFYL